MVGTKSATGWPVAFTSKQTRKIIEKFDPDLSRPVAFLLLPTTTRLCRSSSSCLNTFRSSVDRRKCQRSPVEGRGDQWDQYCKTIFGMTVGRLPGVSTSLGPFRIWIRCQNFLLNWQRCIIPSYVPISFATGSAKNTFWSLFPLYWYFLQGPLSALHFLLWRHRSPR